MSTLQHQDVFEPYFARPDQSEVTIIKRILKRRKQENVDEDEGPPDDPLTR